MSMAPESPYTSEACVGSRPRWSAHSGITTWREARRALSSRMPMPAVRKIPACETATPRRVGSGLVSLGSEPSTATRSGTVTASTAAAAMPATPTQYAPLMPTRAMAAAPINGPMNTPMRLTPPNVERARARNSTGTASVRYFCRARLKTAAAIPTTAIATASSQSPLPITSDTPAASRASAPAAAAPTMDQRSPNFSVIIEAGRLKNHEPSPIRVTISAATATEAPNWTAESATTGRIAPWPTLNRRAGPNAGTAMPRRLNGGGLLGGVIPFILGAGGIGSAETRVPRGHNHKQFDLQGHGLNQTLAKLLSVLSLESGRGARTPTGHHAWFGK